MVSHLPAYVYFVQKRRLLAAVVVDVDSLFVDLSVDAIIFQAKDDSMLLTYSALLKVVSQLSLD